ncbi:hypothetical protein [Anaerosolibacter carboniphilus]|uniref:hypothetical protein n=1 Tax=Anaerosolibacter carboniphilus TaxID=1417629 RepID=UPI001A9B1980|nr:hypothetical protein [Anaerosolibacter carboniphilus]
MAIQCLGMNIEQQQDETLLNKKNKECVNEYGMLSGYDSISYLFGQALKNILYSLNLSLK